MKNITTIKKTDMEKTAIKKITAKITTTALLFFLALFTLTTNLKAQAVQDNSKSGFFAGFVYLQGFQVDSTKSVTTSEITSYRVTGYEDDETTRIDATGGNPNWNTQTETGIRTLISANCKTGETSVDSNGEYYFVAEIFNSFSPGQKPTSADIANPNNDATVTILDPAGLLFSTGVTDGQTSHCFTYFSSSERTAFVFDDYSVSMDSQQITPASSRHRKRQTQRDWFAIRLQRGKMESFLYPLYRAGGRQRAY